MQLYNTAIEPYVNEHLCKCKTTRFVHRPQTRNLSLLISTTITGVPVCYMAQVLGSIKNIHLSYFRNLKFVFSVLICRYSVFCILALGSGQRLLYRLGLVLVLVLRFCAYSYGGVYS